MNDLSAGLQLLRTAIQLEARHIDYDRVTTLAQEYYDIFTGAGVEAYLKKYRSNESDEMFNQMMTIYETVIPGVVDNLDIIFEKPLRSNRVYSSIDTDSETARAEILDRIEKFWQSQTGESGVDAFLQERWKHDVMFDPNTFIAIEFSDFNPNKEKTIPFGIEYSSYEVFDFKFIKGILDYLICELDIFYKRQVTPEKVELIEGSKFIMYLENHAIVYTEVDKDYPVTDIPNPVIVDIMDAETGKVIIRRFVEQIFETKSKRVPAYRVGYKLDAETHKRTCISNIHHALPFFKKELKSGAELDLTIRGHVFPQKYMYGPKCVGDKESGKVCKNGRDQNGTTCAVCKGSGTLPVHTTSQEIIVVPLPTKGEEPVLNLQQAMAYFSPPMELVKFMEEYCDRLTEKAKNAVFPSENLLQKPTVAKTATEMDYSWDTRYDGFRKFTKKYSFCWLFHIQQIAIYTDNDEGLTLYHKFPSDPKLKSASQLLDEGKAAEDAHMPQHVKASIHNDLADLYYADDQDTLTKIQTKNKFLPFVGKTAGELASILNSDEVLPYYKTLYIYFDVIFGIIDNTLGDKFYVMPFEKQKEEVDRQVDELITKINEQKAKAQAEAFDAAGGFA